MSDVLRTRVGFLFGMFLAGGGLLTALESPAGAQGAPDVDEIVDWEAKQAAFEAWLIANDSFDEGVFKAGWDVPSQWSWEYYASWGRRQGAGECETFGPVGVLETQYMMNNCEFYDDRGLLPPDVVCRHDPALPWLPSDDDPSGPRPFLVCESSWSYTHPLTGVSGTWAHRGLDLSEHVISTCEAAVERPYLYVNRTFNRTAVYDSRTDEPWEYVGQHTVRAWVAGTASSSGYSFVADGETLRVAKGQQP